MTAPRKIPWAGLALAAILLGAILLVALVPGRTGSRPRSALSTDPGGRRAALLLFEELGYEARPWSRAPGDLPRGPCVLLLPSDPAEPPGQPTRGRQEPDGPLEPARPLSDRSPEHYLRFLEEGGTIVAAARSRDFLVESLWLEELADLPRPSGRRRLESAVLASGERVAVDAFQRAFDAVDDARFDVLAATEDLAPLAIRLEVGRGGLVLLSDDSFLRNDAIGRADHGLFLVRLVELLGPRTVLFDEYALGGWVPPSLPELAFSPTARILTLHLLALLGIFLWRSALRAAFARDPDRPEALSALERARARAGLHARLGRFEALASSLREGVVARLARRLAPGRLGPGSTGQREGEEGGSRSAARAATVEAVLWPLRNVPEEERRRARELLLGSGPVQGAEDLERLGAELARLELELLAREPDTRSRGPAPRRRSA